MRLYLDAGTATDPHAAPGDPETNTRAAFRSVLGTSEQTFTRDWLSYLDQLAHQ